jgi:hypothetical protein
MHKPGTSFFQSHAIEHHKDGCNEEHHMGLRGQLWDVTLKSFPVIFLISLVTPWFPIVFYPFYLWWFLSWEFIHRAIHDEKGYGWGAWLLPWYRWSRKHHLDHHKKVTKNFGAVFPWSDYFFGTRYLENKRIGEVMASESFTDADLELVRDWLDRQKEYADWGSIPVSVETAIAIEKMLNFCSQWRN